MKLEIKVEELKPLEPRFKKVAKRTVELTSLELQRNVKMLSPVDHGRLQGSWVVFQTGELQRTVKSSAKYAIFVNDGTGIYGPRKTPITHPSIGKMFAFQVNGRMIFTRQIKGIKPRKFVEKSMEMTQSRVQEFMIRALMEENS